jgi:hypothetical protein
VQFKQQKRGQSVQWTRYFSKRSEKRLILPLSFFSISTSSPGKPQIRVTSPPSSCFVFSDSDISKVIWVMNSSKAANKEGFQVEFFKHGLRALASQLANLFNHVVRIGFPSTWSHHLIPLIYKSGPSSNPTITGRSWWTMAHTFSKLYTTILHMKLSNELEHRHLRSRGHAAFRPAHRNIDHIFTLWAIIEEEHHHAAL